MVKPRSNESNPPARPDAAGHLGFHLQGTVRGAVGLYGCGATRRVGWWPWAVPGRTTAAMAKTTAAARARLCAGGVLQLEASERRC